MIQDIFPSRLVNRFEACKMAPSDALVITDGDGKLLVNTDGGEVHFPEGLHGLRVRLLLRPLLDVQRRVRDVL